MGRPNRFGIAIIALLAAAATTTVLSFQAPNARNGNRVVTAPLQLPSHRSSGGHGLHNTGRCCGRCGPPTPGLSATAGANPRKRGAESESESERIPDIQELRDEVRRWTQTRSSEAPLKATMALRVMFRYYRCEGKSKSKIQKQSRRQNGPSVDVVDCTKVINAWSKSRQRDAPRQALAILKVMIATHQKDGNECIRPNTITYSSVINAYARRGEFDGALAVFAMQVRDFKQKGNAEAKPNTYTFNSLINACAKSNREDMSETAEKLLATMNDWHSRGDLDDGPDAYTYSSVINCFSKSNARDAPGKARDILETMVSEHGYGNNDPRRNTVTYAAVMNAYARQGDAKGATEVFEMMQMDHRMGNQNAKPDLQAYNVLVDAWSKSAPKHAPSRTRTILRTMIAQYENGNKRVRPDTVTYAAVMNAHAKQGDVHGATEVFEMMERDYRSGNVDAEPNVNAYSILIDAWCKSTEKDAPSRARDILDRIIAESHVKKSMRPDTVAYNSVLNAHAKQGDVHGATEVFEMMQRDRERGNESAEPNLRTYNILMDAWSKSTELDAPSRARDILDTIVAKSNTRRSMRPDTIAYNSVLNAHAKHGDVEGATEVFEMMEQDYRSGNNNAKPNAITNNIMLDIYSNHKLAREALDS